MVMSNLSALGKLGLNVLHHNFFLKAKMLPSRSFEGVVKKERQGKERQGKETQRAVDLAWVTCSSRSTHTSLWVLRNVTCISVKYGIKSRRSCSSHPAHHWHMKMVCSQDANHHTNAILIS